MHMPPEIKFPRRRGAPAGAGLLEDLQGMQHTASVPCHRPTLSVAAGLRERCWKVSVQAECPSRRSQHNYSGLHFAKGGSWTPWNLDAASYKCIFVAELHMAGASAL